MGQPSNTEERLIAKLIKEAGLEHPSVGFSDRVMDTIKPATSVDIAYKPLITIRGWLFLSLAVIIILVVVSQASGGEVGVFDHVNFSNVVSFPHLFSSIRISNTMLYAICLLGLFWIQIPLLKRWMRKH